MDYSPRLSVRIVAEGDEEEQYLLALKRLCVFSSKVCVTVKNAGNISRVLPVFQNEFRSGKYNLVFTYCDTENSNIDYNNLKIGLSSFFGVGNVDDIVFFGAPQTMIVLINHFSSIPVRSISQDKPSQGKALNRLGINFPGKIYQATQHQLESIDNKITKQNYIQMKANISQLPISDKKPFATNSLQLWNGLDAASLQWLKKLQAKEGLK